jgi:hypothetical protein
LAAVDLATRTVTSFDPIDYNLGNYINATCMVVVNNILYVGGTNSGLRFTGTLATRKYAFAIDLATGLLHPWDPNPNNKVRCLAVGTDTLPGPGPHPPVIFIGGDFSTIGATPTARNFAACVDALVGNVDNWNPDPNGIVFTIATRPSSGVVNYIGGDFTTLLGGTKLRNRAAAVVRNPIIHTAAVTTWDPNFDARVLKMLISRNIIYVSGLFGTVNGGAVIANCLVAIRENNIPPGPPTGQVVPLPFYSSNFNNGDIGDMILYKNALIITGTFTDIRNPPASPFVLRWYIMFFKTDWSTADIEVVLPYANGFNGNQPSIAVDEAREEIYFGHEFTTPAHPAAFSAPSPPFPPPPTPPQAPEIRFLNRSLQNGRPALTMLRWNRVVRDQQANNTDVTSYRIYRSNSKNLEDSILIAEITTLDLAEFIDTLFVEEIDGYYKYCVSAVNNAGEGGKSCANFAETQQLERLS